MSTQMRVGIRSLQGWRSYTSGAFLGIEPCVAGGTIGIKRLPTDSVGTAAVTFVGVQAGSEIRVFLPGGTEVAGVETCSADHALSWPVYSVGSPDNTVTIRIVHAAYKIKEFTYTSALGAQTLPVQQEPDKWYSNP